MRDLSYSQAFRCELAIGKVCKCRCDGILHGAMRASKEDLGYQDFYNNLSELDPHHIDSREQKISKLERRMELADNLASGEVKEYNCFEIVTTLPFGDEGILHCPFCKVYFRVNLLRLVNPQYFNYKSGWLHKCKRAKLVTSEYSAYKSMLIRCYNKQHPSYVNYGAKGFTVTRSWRENFEQFLLDMILKPNENAVIGRVSKEPVYWVKNCSWIVDGKVSKGKEISLLHTMYKFNDEWYKFWLVEYDYGRASKVLRTEEYQAPMTMLDGDMSFSLIKPCEDSLVEKWLAKFGEKFGYQHARQIDNGKAEYVEQSASQLPLYHTSSTTS